MQPPILHNERAAIPNQFNSGKVSWGLVALYVFCLLPLSIDGFGINYSFALIPLGVLISGRKLIRPRGDVMLYIYACMVIFLLSILYQTEWIEYLDRRIVSFVLFMTMFSMCFLQLSEKHIASFKMAVLVAGLLISMQSLVMFISLGTAAQAFESKDILGSQRYGFVYILAFWILWYDTFLVKSRFAKLSILIILALGISLTFNRASIVAFGASGLVAVVHAFYENRRSLVKAVKHIAFGVMFMILGLFVIYLVAPIIFDFFSVRLFEYIASGASSDALADPETSDGTRIFIWSNIIDFVLHNPITGAGFLGVWVLNLFDGFSGSSHSQYFDALFRLGPILFLGYMYFILRMLKQFKGIEPGLFVGLVGILVFGLFNETFKESHGTFILAILLSASMCGSGPKWTQKYYR